MTSPRDPIDDWLGADVTPLSPPPGSLARIRQRARRRKTRQATFAAAGCAVVLAGAVVAPQLIAAGHQAGHRNLPVANGSTFPSLQPSSGSNTPTPYATKPVQIQQRTHLSTTTSRTLPPANFQPTSVTFVGNGTGGVVGAVIGQAGTPGHCATRFCTSLAGSSNYGKTWYGVSAPLASGPSPSGGSGVSQLRFANLRDGWAYGPALYETTDGGWPWHHENIGGQRVIDVEATSTRAFAVFGTCNGTGSDYAASCSSFSLWTSAAGRGTWTQVSVPAAYQQMQSTSSAAPLLVISGSTGYLLTPSGEVLTGPAAAGGAWRAVGQAPCKPGPWNAGGAAAQPSATQSPAAQSSAAPTALLAAGQKLFLACASQAAGGSEQVVLYTSSDGATWRRAGNVTVTGTPTSLTSGLSGQVVMATTAGIEYSANGGKAWQSARGSFPADGFSYVGMTGAKLGVAVPVNSDLHEIFATSDGGKTWQPSPITG